MDSAIDPTINNGSESQDPGTESKGSVVGKEDAKDVTLEEEVKQLVGNVSSWWTGFSKRSQEQINAARKEIESQGGIVSIAKKEAQRFEAQLNEAQKAARERAQVTPTIDESKGKDVESAIDNSGKGKQRQVSEGDDGVAVEMLEEKTRRKSRTDSRSEPMVMGTGEAIFDVDGDAGDEKVSMDHTIQVAKQNAQTALHNVQSFWDRLQADPRLNNIQSSIAKTLENVSLPKAGAETGEGAVAGEKGKSTPIASFTDVSKQFQASFPHLNWKESQALAKKYYDASENVARDWGKEMNALMGDLVKIVPPEEQEGKKTTGNATAPRQTVNVKAGEKDAIATSTTEEEDFDWDGDMDSHSTSTGLQTTTGPPTTSWEGSGSESNLATSPPNTQAVQADAKKQAKTAPQGGKEEEEEEVESDWE